MKSSHLILIVTLLALIAGAATFIRKSSISSDPNQMVGRPLISSNLLQSVAVIRISSASTEDPLSFIRTPEGRWVSEGFHNVPVDFDKLGLLFAILQETKIKRFVTDQADPLKRLNLNTHHIELKAGEDKALLELNIGKNGKNGGTFIQYYGQKAAYLTNYDLYFNSDQAHWVDSRIMKISPNEIQSMSIECANGDLLLKKPKMGAPFSTPLPEGSRPLDQRKIHELLKTLTQAKFSKVTSLDNPDAIEAKKYAKKIELTHFNGDTYTLMIGRKPPEIIPVEESKVKETEQPEETADAKADSDPKGENPEKVEPKPKMTPPGDLFIFYASSAKDFYYGTLNKAIALSFPEYIFNKTPKSLEDILVEKPKEK